VPFWVSVKPLYAEKLNIPAKRVKRENLVIV
jgi:hypothetical protein